jgi:hypothetical protein
MNAATEHSKEWKRYSVLKTLYDDDEWRKLEEDRLVRMMMGGATASHVFDETEDAGVDDMPLSKEEIAKAEMPFLEALGLDDDWDSEALAPPVDKERIAAFHRGDLKREQEDELLHLLARFKSWYVASQECGQERFRRGEPVHFREDRWFHPDALAPLVDEERLSALVRREVSLEEARKLVHLICSFRSWQIASMRVVVRERDRAL